MFIKKKIVKTAKGYRLRPKTHELINKMRLILQTDVDTVISKACRMLYKELKAKQKIKGRT